MLHSAPSFSIFNTTDGNEEMDKQGANKLVEKIAHMGSVEFTFGKSISTNSMALIEEKEGDLEENEVELEPPSPPMYLATGLGFDGNLFLPPSFDDVADGEEYYKRMVDENPSNALLLGNYAKLLESKGDLEEAEEYYFRASILDPIDGEILMRYAKLVWQLHHDQDRAQNYFERAVLVSPQHSDVLAAYARFLWDIEDENEEDFPQNDENKIDENKTHVSIKRIDAGISGGNTVEDADTEEYYKRMVDEHPHSSIALRNYAQFLYKTTGDVIALEDNYSKAILADPTDAETKSEYARLIWDIHHNRRYALCLFEEAALASPEDSNVLAAYARFLWEAVEDEEEEDK